MSSTLRLMVTLGTTNLAFWLMWPASVVRVEARDWGEAPTGLFASTAWLAAIGALLLMPRITQRLGFRATTAGSCGVILAGGLGAGLLGGGPREWLWTALLGVGIGLRWGAVDAWLSDTTEPGRRGRVLSLGETIAGATAALGPAIAAAIAPLYGLSVLGLVAAGLALTGLISCWSVVEPAPRAREADAPPDKRVLVAGISVTALIVVLVSAVCGGLFESGFAAAASLLALGSVEFWGFTAGA